MTDRNTAVPAGENTAPAKAGGNGRTRTRQTLQQSGLENTLTSAVRENFLAPITQILTLLRDVDDCLDPADIRQKIADKALAITGAQRAEIALWDNRRRRLRIWAQSGEAPPKACRLGKLVGQSGMIMRAWKQSSSRPKLVFSNVLKHGKGYILADERTRAEATIRLQHRGRGIGVLNVEWFSKKAKREIHTDIFELLAEHAAIAIMIIDREEAVRGLAGGLAGDGDVSKAICRALERIGDTHGFGNALLFEADKENQCLDVNYMLDNHHARVTKDDHNKWSWSFAETSFASLVYEKRRVYWEADAETSELLNPKGRRKFNITGPILGLPLLHEGLPVGVLVIWGGSASGPSAADAPVLQHIADLLAAYLSPQHLTKEALIPYDVLTTLMRDSQGDIGLGETIQRLLGAILDLGLDRARYFRYLPTADKTNEVFVREMELVQQKDGKREVNNDEVVIEIEKSPYATHIRNDFKEFPDARVFDPVSDPMGIDPHHKELNKSRDTPWITVPIALEGRLMGQLCADNELSKRPIPSLIKRFLSLASGVAALVLSRVSPELNSFPAAMFRKDKDSRFQWVNDIFVEDVARSRRYLKKGDRSYKPEIDLLCQEIVNSSKKDAHYWLTINKLREVIIGKDDLYVFGDPALSKEYIRRDKEVMALAEDGEPLFSGVAEDGVTPKRKSPEPKTWPREENRHGNIIRLVHVGKAPILDDKGAAVGVQGFYIDNTLAHIFNNATEGIFRSTPEGKYIEVNRAMAELLGFEKPEQVLEADLDLETDIYEDPNQRTLFKEQSRLNKGRISNFEYYMKCPGLDADDPRPNVIKVAEYSWEVPDKDGNLLYYEGIVRDITHQIEESSAISRRQLEGQVTETAGLIAHEIRNAIKLALVETNAVRNWTYTRPSETTPVRIADHLQTIAGQIANASKVLDSYQDRDRRKALKPGDINKVITQVLNVTMADQYGIKMAPAFAKLTCYEPVVVPDVELFQVFINLIINSIESAKKNGIADPRISIVTHTESPERPDHHGWAVIVYRDEAGGMSEEDLNALFHRGLKKKEGTHGYGMLVVSKIIDAYRGRPIKRSSSLNDRWTRFEIALPLAEPPTLKKHHETVLPG